jgi:hypothetical protein
MYLFSWPKAGGVGPAFVQHILHTLEHAAFLSTRPRAFSNTRCRANKGMAMSIKKASLDNCRSRLKLRDSEMTSHSFRPANYLQKYLIK